MRSDSEDPFIELTALLIDLPSLRADCQDILSKQACRSQLLGLKRRAAALDTSLVAWLHSLPQAWKQQHYPVIGSETSIACGTEFRLRWASSCTSVRISHVLNSFRVYCIYTHQVLSHVLRKLQGLPKAVLSDLDEAADWKTEEASSRDTIQSMLDGICESVPYHLGWLPADASRSIHEESPPGGYVWYTPPTLPSLIPSTRRVHPATAAFYLQQPLYNAARVAEAPAAQRTWMQQRLQDITKVQGDICSCLLSRVVGAEMLRYIEMDL